MAAWRAGKSSWMKLLSFLEMSKDKLSTAISSNHQYLGDVLIDWTNSYYFRTTHIKGSTPFPFQTSFLSFPIFLSFLFDPTLVLSFPLSLFYFCHSLLFLSLGTLVFRPRGKHFSPNHYLCFFTQLPIRHTEKFPRVYFKVLTFVPLSVHGGHIRMIVIGLKVDTQDTKMLYILVRTTHVTTIITKNILPLLWGNKLSLHRDPRRKKIHFKKRECMVRVTYRSYGIRETCSWMKWSSGLKVLLITFWGRKHNSKRNARTRRSYEPCGIKYNSDLT